VLTSNATQITSHEFLIIHMIGVVISAVYMIGAIEIL
jgi:hypothetical protein